MTPGEKNLVWALKGRNWSPFQSTGANQTRNWRQSLSA